MDPIEHDVVAAVLVRDSRVFLCHRHPQRKWFANVWDVPGGHVEHAESPAEALVREIDEELGVRIRLTRSEPFRTISDGSTLRLRIWIVTEWDGDIVNRAPDEHDAPAKVSRRHLRFAFRPKSNAAG